MKKLVPVFILLLLTGISLQGQIRNASAINLMETVRATKYLDSLGINTELAGSPYLDDKFITGKIIMSDGGIFDNLQLRYNIYNDQIEFLADNQTYTLQDKAEVKEVVLGDKIFKIISYNSKITSGVGHMECIIEGYCSLYVKYQVKLLKGEPSTGYSPATPDHFEKSPPLYFIKTGEREAIVINNQKDLLLYLDEHRNEVESFIRKEKLNIKKLPDLVKAINYLNSLAQKYPAH